MKTFRVTIKVSVRERPDYDKINAILEALGFLRTHRRSSRMTYYDYVTDSTLESVYELLVRTLSKFHKQFAVFVHELGNQRGVGMIA